MRFLRARPRQTLLRPSLGLLHRVVIAASIGVLLPACGEAPPPPPAQGGVDASEQRKIEKSKKLIADANRAANSKSYGKARKLLREASQLGVESHRFEIGEVEEKIDKREAKLWASEMGERFEQKDCLGAFKEMSKQMDDLASETFTRELRRLTADKATKCLTTVVDEATLATSYADARALVNAPETRDVLGAQAWKKVSAELDTTILDALRSQLSDDIKAKRWMQAMEKLDGYVKKGDADEAQAQALLADVRKALAPELDTMLTRAIGQRDAATILKVANTLIARVRWEAVPPDQIELAKDKALPLPLYKKREALSAWVEGQRAGMKIKKKPEKRWTHGKVMLFPAAAIDGESKRDIAPATELWVIAQTKEKALVADAEPGAGPAGFEKVLGWVPVNRLAVESTATWLPPNDQLKGTQVWAPLRQPDPTLELGVVTDVQGKDILVKRLADDKVLKMQRKQLRNGKLVAGMKVLAFCTAKDQPAKIEEVLTAGRAVPSVRISCEGGATKEEFLPGLRAKPESLPPSK